MLAVPTPTPGVPPPGSEWVHEVKWDGVRIMASVTGGRLRLTNRTEGDVTAGYPELTATVGSLPDVLLDGEVVAFDQSGRPTLQAIAHRMHVRAPGRTAALARTHPVTYMVFDLLSYDGQDLTRLPLTERRRLLDGLGLEQVTGTHLGAPCWRLSEQHDDGDLLAEVTAAGGLEGVMSKRRTSPYLPGQRSDHWLKVPHRKELVAVIGGWTPETDSIDRLGAVWVGHPSDESTFTVRPVLYPLSRVGSGLSHAQRADLLKVLREIEVRDCPFDPRPDSIDVRRTRWVEPLLCVQIRYLGHTEGGTLRQPVLRALRPDVLPLDAADAGVWQISG
jgi:bifunctional non-homologous end joining protein LigD